MTYNELCKDERVQERFKDNNFINHGFCERHKCNITSDMDGGEQCPGWWEFYYSDKEEKAFTDEYICGRYESSIKQHWTYKPDLNNLWQWWMETTGMDWITSHSMFGARLAAQSYIEPTNALYLTRKFESLEHALLACILERSEK